MFYAYIPAPNLGEMISLIVPEIDVVLIFMLMALSGIPNKNQNFKILAVSHIRFSTIKNVNFLSGSEIRGVVCLCVCVSLFIGLDRVSCKTDEPIEMSLGGGHDTVFHRGAHWRHLANTV